MSEVRPVLPYSANHAEHAPTLCGKNTAFSARPGGTQVVATTRLERVARHFTAKEKRKHQANSMHLTCVTKSVFGVIKFFDAGKHPIIRQNNYRFKPNRIMCGQHDTHSLLISA
jgi:hypothetical protein